MRLFNCILIVSYYKFWSNLIYNQTMFWILQNNKKTKWKNNKHDKFTIFYCTQSWCFWCSAEAEEDHDDDFCLHGVDLATETSEAGLDRASKRTFFILNFASWILITSQECVHVSQVPMLSYALPYITIPSRYVFATLYKETFSINFMMKNRNYCTAFHLNERWFGSPGKQAGRQASREEWERVRHCMFTSIPEEEKIRVEMRKRKPLCSH